MSVVVLRAGHCSRADGQVSTKQRFYENIPKAPLKYMLQQVACDRLARSHFEDPVISYSPNNSRFTLTTAPSAASVAGLSEAASPLPV